MSIGSGSTWPPLDRLVIASKNQDKINEIEVVLVAEGVVDEIVRGLAWTDVQETGTTLEENARLKARAVVEATRLPALADDTGLEVVGLGGGPGVHTARFAGPYASYENNVAKMLEVMKGVEDRRAAFRTVVALVWPDGLELLAEGRLEGRLTTAPKGDFGFGYDPIFEVDGKTLGELTPEAKSELSHRAKAVRLLAERLRAGVGSCPGTGL